MANNRMFLVNKRTGHRLLIAKYYPSTGWSPKQDIEPMLTNFFDCNDDVPSMGGDTDYAIEYESTSTPT
jgi:hypothetical protein